MYLQKTLFLILTLLFLFSCAQTGVKQAEQPMSSNKVMTQEEVDKMNAQAIERVSKKLKELSDAAVKAGPEKVRFLASDMYLKASAALMEGDYYTANLIFNHLVQLVPEDHFIRQKYAVSLIRTGELEKSEGILRDIFEKTGRKDPKVGLVLAGVYGSLGNIAQARAIYQRLIVKNPKNEEACIFLSKSYTIEKKYKSAIGLLKKCSARNPSKGVFDYYIGKTYLEQKQYGSAKIYFRKALKRESDFSLAVMAIGIISEDQGKYKTAEKVYKRFLKKNPNDTLILSRLVQLLLTQEKIGPGGVPSTAKYEEIIQYAERLSDYEPDNLNLKVKLGILYKDIKQYPKAIKVFKDLLKFAPDNDMILYYLGSIFQEVKNYQDAIAYYGKIPEGSGLYQDSSFQIAQMLSLLAKNDFFQNKEKGDQHEAFISFVDAKIKEISAFKVEFSVVKAAYFESLEDNDEAIDVLEYVKEDKAFENEHRFYLASLFEKEEEYKKATELIEEVIEYDPQNAHAWNFLGYSLLERGEEMKKAFEYIQKAIKLKPNDGYIRDSLGWYYYKTGDVKQAQVEIKKALGMVPDDVAINKHMAIIYSAMKDFAKAREYIMKALAVVQTETERKELSDALKQLRQNRIPASFKEK